MFASGTNAGFDELPETIRKSAGVSQSSTAKERVSSGVFAMMARSGMGEMNGALAPRPTCTPNEALAVPPSVSATVMVILVQPAKLVVVVNVNVRFVPLPPNTKLVLRTRLVCEELAVMTKASAGVSRSETMNGIDPPAEFTGSPTEPPRSEIVGGVFVEFTVRTKDVDVVFPSVSRTVTVIVVVPVWFVAGVIVIIRLVPLPEITIFASGTSGVFDEFPETIRKSGGVSQSSTAKEIVSGAEFAMMPRSGMGEMTGAGGPRPMVTPNDTLAVSPSVSVTVMVILVKRA
jgi:hypothetical protein